MHQCAAVSLARWDDFLDQTPLSPEQEDAFLDYLVARPWKPTDSVEHLERAYYDFVDGKG